MPTPIQFVIESIRATKNVKKKQVKSTANIQSPCGVCWKNVLYNQPSLHCHMCLQSIHLKCTDMTLPEYHIITARNDQNPEPNESHLWYCPKCTVLQNAEHFHFGLESTYELNKINMSNSMKLVEMIPEFEINSQILRVDDLCSKDIDENLVNKINCKYFTNDEFSKLSNDINSFNIFHADVNGLEFHFEELHHFLSNASLDFNAICITETSQPNESDFVRNVNINNYCKLYTTETMTGKSGVAIYIKNNLETIERNDLKIKDVEYETVWVEIKNKREQKYTHRVHLSSSPYEQYG